jgi:RND superfamily putative drug exporter
VQASLLPVFAFVVGASLVLLFIVFRSWLLPVKAVGANLLAVAAGYGAVVAVFQFGWLGGWLGLSPPLAAIPPVVPLLMFCLSFGLSMDYEVFLLRAVQRRWRQSGDNAAAAAGALVATAPVITGAAGVMAIVFASYLATDVVLLKMLGLGLAVTVLVDATLIRCLIVPALVCVAGRWNWVPGVRPALDGPR